MIPIHHKCPKNKLCFLYKCIQQCGTYFLPLYRFVTNDFFQMYVCNVIQTNALDSRGNMETLNVYFLYTNTQNTL